MDVNRSRLKSFSSHQRRKQIQILSLIGVDQYSMWSYLMNCYWLSSFNNFLNFCITFYCEDHRLFCGDPNYSDCDNGFNPNYCDYYNPNYCDYYNPNYCDNYNPNYCDYYNPNYCDYYNRKYVSHLMWKSHKISCQSSFTKMKIKKLISANMYVLYIVWYSVHEASAKYLFSNFMVDIAVNMEDWLK